jgi:hypothetical protein
MKALLERVKISWENVIKLGFEEMFVRRRQCGLESSTSVRGSKASPCEQGKYDCFLKGKELIDQLSNYKLLKKV